MKQLRIIFILCGLQILSACEQNITLELPHYDPKVAVYCVLTPSQQPVMYLNLSKSYYSYGDTSSSLGFIKNAQVYITDQTSNYTDTLKLDSGNVYTAYQGVVYTWFYKGRHNVKAGDHYATQIHYNGKILTAETTVPPAVIDDHYTEEKLVDSIFGTQGYEIHAFVNDQAGVANYYSLIEPSQQGDIQDWTSDLGLDGKQLELIYDLDTFRQPPFSVAMSIASASKATAVYLQDLTNQAQSSQDPFSQPVTLESNINGGLGLFGAITYSTFLVNIK